VDIFSVFLKVFTTEGGLFVLSHSLG
jgi:hypothetical protein